MAIEVEGGGGGVFVPSEVSTVQRLSAGTGTLFTLTPPPGGRVILYRLGFVSPSAANLPDVTVSGSINGVIITGSLSRSTTSDGRFSIGVYSNETTQSNTTIPYIVFEDEEIVTVSTPSSISDDVTYQYAFGSIK